ncbi:MAG: acyl-CoA dehydratase activase-related protein, partial [Chromatiales bacterium]|nr:acyl-CoA dehydratase activase-related protein [Chromatiales bacterium]
ILASAVWAIVENMAHGLWPQIDLPRHAVVLLHGQTMRSDPLPLAVVQRLAAHLEAPVYGLVPPHPGHRACFGLIHTLGQVAPAGDTTLPLAPFVEAHFEKRIIECRGAACDDPDARCNRAHLSCRRGEGERKLSFTLGGCSAINELLARKLAVDGERPLVQAVPDSYKALWDYVDERLPRSEAPDRLVIARSFVISEWAFLLGRLLQTLGLPVHVDDVHAEDLTDAQPLFNIDTCAPHMGAVGQYRRLAGQPHGMILAPQIEYLPTDGVSRGLACTLNQGGVAVAANLATLAHGGARFHLFHLDLGRLDTEPLLEQFVTRLAPVFEHYGIAPTRATLAAAIAQAVSAHRQLRTEVADLAARYASEALDEGRQVALVVGREYILNPGIYDSHVRRLLRDQNLTVIPSWVLDVELDPDYHDIYWRNPHFILTLLDGVARRELHRRLRHAGLRAVFERIETGAALLPVVQVSTFSCGPDSIIRPMVAEIMRRRPFLLIQSDAVLKELAHLENRVNTYMKQLAPDLRLQRASSDAAHFSVRTLDELDLHDPVNADTDVIYFPTLADNRSLTSVLRGAGFTCIDNYDDDDFDLARRVHDGRRTTGDAVCAPLAAVYGDLERAIADFTRRRAQGDPLVAGKKRLLYFEIKGTGPCRQGLYTNVHQVLFQRGPRAEGRACNALPGDGVLKMLAGREYEGFNFGMPEWVLVRAHQGTILQGVLHALFFAAAGECADYAGFERFQREFRALKEELYRRIERHARPR